MKFTGLVIATLRLEEYLPSVDIQDANFHYQPHQCFLHFSVEDKHFQFVVLPFGLPSASRIFTKVLASLLSFLRTLGFQVTGYQYDLLLMDSSPFQLSVNIQKTVQML